ncbi:uncharacterized protein YbjQ (UPF0145 family)/CDGSH-type Zn-finger protein [Clostridium punense]|uniref:UPF0145 protein J2Z44_000375 n=1 Tax=Clostridium punense TaxID=1054297 RepID=A0ABS4JYI7_9CLOT|nr:MULTISPECIES: YbjQ family protein [Clostridium]EQB87965.1 hypothetical protein M918_06555 [Clostridium sp. BL8]MBP2020591.1 uncharacterized protein YbjQ (UPF0145 family)/CDGSH-type Zn-finger protein [Clostridium punense]
MKNKILVSSTNTLEGYEIKTYYGLCSERIVVGAGVFSEFFAGFTDLFGGRSRQFEERLKELYDSAMEKLTKTAASMGANALLGVTLDIDEISGKGTQMFMINASGTAVLVNRTSQDTNQEETLSEEKGKITGYDLRKEIIRRNVIKKLDESEHRDDVFEGLKTLINEDILLPIDYVLNLTNKETYRYARLSDTNFAEYLDLYYDEEFNKDLNEFLLKCHKYSNLYFEIYNLFAKPDYVLLVDLVDKLNVEVLIRSVVPVLLKYKSSYSEKDISSLEMIYEKLKKIRNTEIVEVSKSSFGKEVWVCGCGKKIDINSEYCNCTKGKNGLTAEENELIEKAIKQVGDIKDALGAELL